jgi:hypothetical protein
VGWSWRDVSPSHSAPTTSSSVEERGSGLRHVSLAVVGVPEAIAIIGRDVQIGISVDGDDLA